MKSTNYFRIISLFIFTFFSTFDNSFSQDTLSLPAVQFASMVTDGKYLYMFGGIADNKISDNTLKKRLSPNSILLNDLSVGDPEQNKWAKEEPIDGVKPEARTYQQAVLLRDNIVVFGGKNGGPILTDLWKYEIEKKTWTKIEQSGITPPGRLLPSLSTINDGLILVGGKGPQGEYVADCWYYNYQSNVWTQKANPPADVELDGHKSVNVNDNTVALWGGDNNTKVKEVWTYNINSNTWTKNTTSGTGPQNKRGGFIMEKIDNKAYIGGGTENFTTKVNDFYSLNLATWEWTRLADMPAKLFAASSSVLNGKLYVYGGNDENSQRSNKIYAYDPSTNQWSEKKPERVYLPKAPTNLTLEYKNGMITLRWKDNSMVEDGYVVKKSKKEKGVWEVPQVYMLLRDEEELDKITCEPPEELKFDIWAYNFAGESDYLSTEFTVTDVEKSDHIPLTYYLSQNYPNPFNPETNIDFDLPSSEKVTLKVYDLLGREIKTLIEKELMAGKHKIKFDGGSLTSGIYFYKIIAGNYTETKKLLLLR